METFELFLSDLTEDAQKRFLDFMELEDEGNYDIFPISIMEKPESED